MLCENCKKNIATTYFKQTVNGKSSEIFLCSECAAKLGLDNSMTNFGFDSMLPNFFSAATELQEVRCPDCGMLYSDIVKTGRVGCDKCYETFSKRLTGAINRIHGNKKHVGKVPLSFAGNKATDIKKLRKELEKAIRDENFEQAAVLRDKIKAAEAENGKEA